MEEKEEKKEKEEIEQKEEKGEKEEEEEKQETLTEAWSPPGARPLHLEPSCPHSARQPAPRDLLLPLAFPYARVQC